MCNSGHGVEDPHHAGAMRSCDPDPTAEVASRVLTLCASDGGLAGPQRQPGTGLMLALVVPISCACDYFLTILSMSL